jgi:hypothetical protein
MIAINLYVGLPPLNGFPRTRNIAGIILALIALANVVGTYLFGSWGRTRRRKYLLVALEGVGAAGRQKRRRISKPGNLLFRQQR